MKSLFSTYFQSADFFNALINDFRSCLLRQNLVSGSVGVKKEIDELNRYEGKTTRIPLFEDKINCTVTGFPQNIREISIVLPALRASHLSALINDKILSDSTKPPYY